MGTGTQGSAWELGDYCGAQRRFALRSPKSETVTEAKILLLLRRFNYVLYWIFQLYAMVRDKMQNGLLAKPQD